MKKWKTVTITILVILVLWSIFQVYRSYYLLKESNYTVASEKTSKPIRFVTISDQHDHLFGAANELLKEKVLECNPDLLFLDGDMINDNSGDCNELCTFIKDMTAHMPVYFALGNHELGYMENHPELIEQLEAAGAVVLDKEYVDIEVNGQKLRIGGLYDFAFALDDYNSTNPENMDSEVYEFLTDFEDTAVYKIMLAHRPESFILGEAPATWDIDLVVSGHAHGGQVVLPVLGPLWAPEQGYFPDCVKGIHEYECFDIIVTSGLSSELDKIPRFNNPPDVMVVDLLPQGR